VTTIRDAFLAAAPDDRFPLAVVPLPVTLPHEWPAETPGGAQRVWYRTSFDSPAGSAVSPGGSDAMTGLLLSRACGRLLVILNGVLIHRDGDATGLADRNCDRSRLVSLPAPVLRSAGNVLDLRLEALGPREVTARQRAGGLSALEVGPYGELERRHERHRAWHITSVQVSGWVVAVLGVFLAAMGWVNRRDPTFVYFGLMAVSWTLVTQRAWWPAAPGNPFALQWMLAATYAPATAAAVLFLLRFAGLRPPHVNRLLLAQCLLMPASLLLAGPSRAFAVAIAWYGLFALQFAAAAVACLRRLRQAPEGDFRLAAAVLVAAGGLIAFELAVQAGWAAPALVPLAPFGVALLIVAVAFRLLRSFVTALAAAEADRIQMQGRVADATAEIERNFAQLSELRVEQVTEKERKRIAADLHDDLGAKLLTIVHTSESERISTLAREALEEMRLSVRGLTGKPVRVADALADWRVETVGRLGQAGIEADWRSPTEEGEQRLAARTYVQTTRILREATSNIIKHSGASFVKVRCAIGAEDFVLVIQDNGKGISTEMSGKLDRGQGMYSMKNRAKQMQGQCLVESGPGYGTVIRLTLPLNERAAATPQA
jgi:signal transduction histidine kinase